VPSGFVYLDIYYSGDISTDTRLWIAFDPDINVSDGDESTLSIPLGDYLYTVEGYDAHVVLPWSAPDVPDGSYYVYSWIDVTADGVMDEYESATYSALHGSQVGYGFSAAPITIVHSSGYPEAVFPTSRVNGGPAPRIDLSLSNG